MKQEDLLGKIVTGACVDDSVLLTFEDGSTLRLADEGQSCCESRYMTCDDDPSVLIGLPFMGYEVLDVLYSNYGGDFEHEIQFLEVKAGINSITVANHNEHNGYYGGFFIHAQITGAH